MDARVHSSSPADAHAVHLVEPSTVPPPLQGSVCTEDGVTIAYEVHGTGPDSQPGAPDKRPRVIMIMGLACGRSGWRWQLKDLLTPPAQHQRDSGGGGGCSLCGGGAAAAAAAAAGVAAACPRASRGGSSGSGSGSFSGGTGSGSSGSSSLIGTVGGALAAQQSPMVVCVFDNRGVGDSSAPQSRDAYSTSTMARDALAVMDHLGWWDAHVVGFSMGGMVATQVAVQAPTRVVSLTLISTTAGGWDTVPLSLRGLRRGLGLLLARTPEDQADATLAMHFSRRTLREWVARHSAPRNDLLRREYMAPGGGGPQPPHGFRGQVRACWHHRVSDADARTLREAGFPICILHGRYDALAAPSHAEALARRLAAPLVTLHGAHFIVRECAAQVNHLLASLVLGAQLQGTFHTASNAAYLEPDSRTQHAWRQQQQQQQQGGGEGGAPGGGAWKAPPPAARSA